MSDASELRAIRKRLNRLTASVADLPSDSPASLLYGHLSTVLSEYERGDLSAEDVRREADRAVKEYEAATALPEQPLNRKKRRDREFTRKIETFVSPAIFSRTNRFR